LFVVVWVLRVLLINRNAWGESFNKTQICFVGDAPVLRVPLITFTTEKNPGTLQIQTGEVASPHGSLAVHGKFAQIFDRNSLDRLVLQWMTCTEHPIERQIPNHPKTSVRYDSFRD